MRVDPAASLMKAACLVLCAHFTLVVHGAENPMLNSTAVAIWEQASARNASQSLIEEAREALRHKLSHDTQDSASAAIYLGHMAFMMKRDFDEAIALYEEAQGDIEEGDPLWPEMTFNLATCYQHEQPVSASRIEKAISLFTQILDAPLDMENPKYAVFKRRSLLNLGRIAELRNYYVDKPELETAREYYIDLINRYAGTHEEAEAVFRLASTYFQEGANPPQDQRGEWDWREGQIRNAIKILKDWLTDHPRDSLAPGMWEYMGTITLMLPPHEGQDMAALNYFMHSLGDQAMLEGGDPIDHKTSPDRVNAGYHYWRTAILAQRCGYRQIALEYYVRGLTEVETYNKGPEGILQLTENMGFSRDAILERMRHQYLVLGYTEAETNHLIQKFEFLEPPVGLEVPLP